MGAKKRSLREWEGGQKSPLYWIATWFGCGLLKPAPGTWGSLATLPLLIFVAQFTHVGILAPDDQWPYVSFTISFVHFPIILALFLIGIWVINRIESRSGIHDAPEIVIDEVVGMYIASLMALGPDWQMSLLAVIPAFLLFRFFDIVKPWPIGWLDRRVSGGFGVMIDDVIAGLMALGIQILLVGLLFQNSSYFNPPGTTG